MTNPPISAALAGRRMLHHRCDRLRRRGAARAGAVRPARHPRWFCSSAPRGANGAAERVANLLRGAAFGRLRDRDGDEAVDALDRRHGSRSSTATSTTSRRCRTTSTSSSTAPARCRSTRRSTRASRPTSTARSTCSPPSTRAAAARTTCTSPRRTSPVASKATSAKAASTTTSTGGTRPSSPAAPRTRSRSRAGPPEQLAEFSAEAEKQHDVTGASSVAAEAEQRRRDWVEQVPGRGGPGTRAQPRVDRLLHVHQGDGGTRGRADRDASAGHRAAARASSRARSTQPYPGWIQGFKMAEPIILAFGRGDLPEFPGIPDGVIDIIPVDLVVNATLAAAAQRPEPGQPGVLHDLFRRPEPAAVRLLYELVREYFLEHPMVQRDRGEVKVPTWNWPGLARVGQLIKLARARPAHRRPGRDLAPPLEPDARLGQVARPAEGPASTSCAATSTSTSPTPRPSCTSPTTRRSRCTKRCIQTMRGRFGFDAAVIDWRYYLQDVHVPAVVDADDRACRQCAGPGRSRPGRSGTEHARRRRRLRHGRHPAVEQRRRGLPRAAAAGARRCRRRHARSARSPAPCPAGSRRREGPVGVPAAGLPALRRRLARRARPDRRRAGHARRCSPGSRPPRSGRSASIGRPAIASSSSRAR